MIKSSNTSCQKQRFSFRKSCAYGMVSCLIGLFVGLSLAGAPVQADALEGKSVETVDTALVSTTMANEEKIVGSDALTSNLATQPLPVVEQESSPSSLIGSATAEPKTEVNQTEQPSTSEQFNRSKLKINQTVNVQGIVASDLGKWGAQGFYLQVNNDQGIYVYPGKNELNPHDLKKGDLVSFSAVVGEHNKNLQLVKVSDLKVASKEHEVLVKSTEIPKVTKEMIDSYVELSQLTVTDLKLQGKYKNTIIKVTDKKGQEIELFADNRATGDFDVVSKFIKKDDKIQLVKGFVSQFGKKYQLKLASLNDVVLSQSTGNENRLPEKETTLTVVNHVGDIQGASHVSPLVDKEVKVSHVVVTKLDQQKGFYVQDLKPDNKLETSDALYVVSQETVKVGDELIIEGLVVENHGDGYAEKTKTDLTITQLVARKVEKVGTAEVPKPLLLGSNIPMDTIDNDGLSAFEPKEDALDFWESLEGMLVEVPKPQILGPQKYGYLYVLPEGYQGERNNANGISLRPDGHNTEVIVLMTGNRKYRAKAKDYFTENIVGNVTYDYSEYKVDLRGQKLPKKMDGGLTREASTIVFDENKLTIASYNIENFSANADKKETPEDKVEKIAKSFINEINQPDIISLIEVQDNTGSKDDGVTSGVESGERLSKKIQALGGPSYKYIEIAPENNADGGKPGANIRVAFLYNPERVTLPNKASASSTEAAVFVNGELAKNPARISPTSPAFTNVRKSLAVEFEFKGEKVIVIANHLKSKNGDNPLYGRIQPAIENSKASRVAQAQEINAFVKSGLAQNPNLKFVLTGDFNDFEFSETIKATEGDELVNLLSNHAKEDRYSYFYRGNNQSLDNILVSKNLLENIKFDAIHVNSSFMEEDGRASDHDPLIVQLDFTKFVNKTDSEQPKVPETDKKPTEEGEKTEQSMSEQPKKTMGNKEELPLAPMTEHHQLSSEQVTNEHFNKSVEVEKAMPMVSNNKHLPKTNDISSLSSLVFGVSTVILSSVGIGRPRRKKN